MIYQVLSAGAVCVDAPEKIRGKVPSESEVLKKTSESYLVAWLFYDRSSCFFESTSHPSGNGRFDVKVGSGACVLESLMCLLFYALRDNAIRKLLPTLPGMAGLM